MWKRNKMSLGWVAFGFMVSLSVCSVSQASVIYWGLPAIYSQGPGNFIAGAMSNMTARAYGAYAFTDYASAWGINNPVVPGFFGPGGGLGLANLSTWGQMYSLASTYGYNSAVFNNPWMNYSFLPLSTPYTSGYTFPNYSLFTPSYLPLNTYSPYNLGVNVTPWTTPSSTLLTIPATTTTTTTTTR